jgi:hypothetical protein
MNWKRLDVLTLAVGSLVALGLSAQPAVAQDTYVYGRQIEITGFGGYYIAQDIYTVTDNSVGGEGTTLGLDNSPMWGGRIGIYPTRYGGIEFAYARQGSDITVRSNYDYSPGDTGLRGRIDYDSYDINFVARQQNLANPRVTGFGTIGFGWTVTHPQLENTTVNVGSNTLFGINFGLGAKIGIKPGLGLRLEGRWKISQTNLTTGTYNYCDYWGYCYGYTSNSYDSGELTAGLTYTLGGR